MVGNQLGTDPQIDLGVMAQAFSVSEAEGLQQTGLLAVQEQSPPDGLPLVLLLTVQVNLYHKVFKIHTHAVKHKARRP